MNKYAKSIKESKVWDKDFKDLDDVLDNGVLKCNEIDLEGKFFMSILRTSNMLEEGMTKILEQFNISMPQLEILQNLYFSKNDSVSQYLLSKMVFCSKANMSTILSRMEEKGLIQRLVNPNSKREKLIKITKLGEEKIDEYFEVINSNKIEFSKSDQKLVSEMIVFLQNLRSKMRCMEEK